MKISIITATWNAAAHLRHCLDGVATQQTGVGPCGNRASVEHLIIDGDSSDDTLDIVRQYRHISRIISEPDHGIYDAMNKGLRLTEGELVGILNADDFYAGSEVLAKVASVFEDPEVDACYGDLCYVAEKPVTRDSLLVTGEGQRPVTGDSLFVMGKGKKSEEAPNPNHKSPDSELNQSPITNHKSPNFKILRYWRSGTFDLKKFYLGWMPPHPTLFVRRRVYEQFGLFNLDLGSAADYELMLRFLFKHRINVKYIPEVLVYMRAGGASNESFKARLKANRMDRKAWEVNGLRPYPWTIPLKPVRKIPQWFMKP